MVISTGRLPIIPIRKTCPNPDSGWMKKPGTRSIPISSPSRIFMCFRSIWHSRTCSTTGGCGILFSLNRDLHSEEMRRERTNPRGGLCTGLLEDHAREPAIEAFIYHAHVDHRDEFDSQSGDCGAGIKTSSSAQCAGHNPNQPTLCSGTLMGQSNPEF